MTREVTLVRFRRVIASVVLTTLLLGYMPVPVGAQSDVLGPSNAQVNCPNFLPASEGGQQHAQEVYNSDTSDPYGLDGPVGPNNDTRGEPGVACETESDLGTESRATCQNFRETRHAQALLDAAGRNDPYDLDPDRNGVACDGGGGGDLETLDGVPPSTRGTTVVVSTGAIDTGESLEARLEARFAALEAEFAEFEARAANGFGRFPDSEDEATVGGQGTTVVVSTSQQPVTVAQRTSPDDDRPTLRAQKVQDGKVDRTKERKNKRDRPKGKHRNRR